MESKKKAGDGEQKICRKTDGKRWRCKNAFSDNELQYCDKHYKDFLTENPSTKSKIIDFGTPVPPKKKKKKGEEKEKLPADEERCCKNNGADWRCKNLRMRKHGGKVRNYKFCEEHYYKMQESCKKMIDKKNNTDGEFGGGVETRDSKRKKMLLMEEDDDDDETREIQPTTSNTSVGGGGANIGAKRKNVERTDGDREHESLPGNTEAVAELESLEHYKSKCFDLYLKLEQKNVECAKLQGKLVEVETRKTTATDETDAAECWKKLFSYFESRIQRKENENLTMESRISKLESLILRMESTNSTTAGFVDSRISKLEMENENSTRRFESRISDLESLVQRMGNENLAMAGESRISNLERLVLRSGNERCVQLRNSENLVSEARGLQNGVTQSGEKQRDKNQRSKPNAETSSGGRKDSHVYKCKTKEKVENVSDIGVNKHPESEPEFPKYSAKNMSSGTLHLSGGGENVEERPSQHGSLSQDHLDKNKEPFANLVSDDCGESPGGSEDSDSSDGSENSLGGLMDMLAMKYRDRNDDKEMKWKSEDDMLSSFEEDPELCMRAVCALHRQQTSEDEISEKGLFHFSDVLRITTLANFLMEEDCRGDLKKSLKELEIFDSKGVVDCKRMARRYSNQLFSVYQNGKDPFFLPATTASHGDQADK